MSESDLPGQLPPRRSRAIRRPAAGGEPVPPQPTPAAPLTAAEPPADPRPEKAEPSSPLWNGRSTEPPQAAAPVKWSTRAPFPDKAAPRPVEARPTGAAAAARRRAEPAAACSPAEAPLLRMPPPPPSSSVGPILAVLAGLVLVGGALKLAWPTGGPTRPVLAGSPTPVALATTPTIVPPVVTQTPDKPVYNPWADGKRPPVRRPRPVVVVVPATPPQPVAAVRPPKPVRPAPAPVPARLPTPDQHYPQARPKPTLPPQAAMWPPSDPYDPYAMMPPQTGSAPVPSRSLDMKVTTGMILGGSEPLKAYSLSLLVHNRSTERIERMRILLKRGAEVYETSSFSALEPGQRQELQLAFSSVPKKFHPQRLEVQWSTIAGDFVTEKPVSDLSWSKASGTPPY